MNRGAGGAQLGTSGHASASNWSTCRVSRFPLWVKLLGVVAVLAVACVGLTFVPTGEVAYKPVAPIDLDGKVSFENQQAEPLQGRLYLVGVSERRVNLLERLYLGVADQQVDFAPAPRGGGSGPSHRDVVSMSQAKQVAAGVALRLANERVRFRGNGASVDQVEPGSPAAGALRAGDIITAVNGRPVESAVDVVEAVRELRPGSRVTFGVSRAGQPLRPTLRTAAAEGGGSRIGAALSTLGLKVELPYDVTIDSGEVVGPSAGLAFALYIYDSRSSRDLLRGRHVVASGALSPDGQVLAVGRIRQKAIAAQEANRDVLVVPAANAEDARRAVREACSEGTDCLQVVPVRTAREAVDLLLLDDAQLGARLTALER